MKLDRERERERERESKSQNLFSFKNLLRAYYSCRKRKRKTINAAKFEINFERELLRIEQELKSYTYQPGRSICFVITNPKPREVFAADFRDRVVHHLLVGYLEPIWEKIFIYQSYSCRNEKGAHLAINDLKRYSRKITTNFSKPAYYLQIDISAFFMSLKKDILFNLIKRHTKNTDILWLTEKIIFQNQTKNFYYKGDKNLIKLIPHHKSLFNVSPDQGLPIGNLTSQFFANIYLNELDQFAKHNLKISYYLRYVDDILIFHQDINQLEEWASQIDIFLQEKLELKLHPDKKYLKSIYDSINFVGYIINPQNTLVRNRTVNSLKKKLYNFNRKILKQYPEQPIYSWTPELCEKFKQIFETINSYYGHFKHADTYNLRKHLYKKHFNILKIYLIPSDKNYNYFKWDIGS